MIKIGIMEMPAPNKGKKLTIRVGGKKYARFPIKTKRVTKEDDIVKVVTCHAKPFLESCDTLCISERIIAIMQGRSFPISDICPSLVARILCKYVTNHPGGIGLRSPWTMELALREAGTLRILFASAMAMLTKPFGLRGVFYYIAGNDTNAIDGPCDYTLPPGNTHAKLGPKNPEKVVQDLAQRLNCGVAIIDANDYGVRVLGASEGVDKKIIKKIFVDNPLGQSDEQTPIAIVRAI